MVRNVKVFIGHKIDGPNGENEKIAQRIESALKTYDPDITVWRAVERMHLGDEKDRKFAHNIRNSTHYIVIVSCEYIDTDSNYISKETTTAKTLGLPICPIIFNDRAGEKTIAYLKNKNKPLYDIIVASHYISKEDIETQIAPAIEQWKSEQQIATLKLCATGLFLAFLLGLLHQMSK